MVDVPLPIRDEQRPLRSMFLDINAFFASVEQQERPELRGKPVAVGAVDADTSFVIAASYEAKKFGIRCGTMIRDAKRMCRDLQFVRARPQVYLAYHHEICRVAETVLPVDRVCSIDEMRFALIGREREPQQARKLADEVKRRLRSEVGDCIRCSVGIAPNPFLAKLGTELQKPDGLVVIQRDDLPHALHSLRLTDFTGINVRMAARLHAAGIFTAEALCAADRPTLLAAFGSVIGEKWWYLLRGYELTDDESERKSLSHSHVLAPELRNDEGCYQVLLRLIQKATARLRSQGLRAQTVTFYVSGFTAAWKASEHLPATDDAIAINQALARVWPARNYERPRGVGVVFADLVDAHHFTPSLFEDRQQPDRHRLMEAVDQVNEKFGKNTIYLAGMQRTRDAAPERIAFTKTWLFSEGKGDNEWVDTFRGARTADS